MVNFTKIGLATLAISAISPARVGDLRVSEGGGFDRPPSRIIYRIKAAIKCVMAMRTPADTVISNLAYWLLNRSFIGVLGSFQESLEEWG
ncbi:hypothetical protein [Rhizobium sp.]|uniref:hypothetical protein n=1 Tax=Rhizobium sp. TaxID=391 RepID=UPI0028ACF64E